MAGDPAPPPSNGPAQPDPGDDGRPGRCRLAGLAFNRLTETQVIGYIIEALRLGRGGWVVNPNIDVCRLATRDPGVRDLISSASLILADGMPLLWATSLRGDPLPGRIAGGSLIFSLTRAAAENGRSIYLLGGAPGVPERAAEELRSRYPALAIAGTDAPPVGFDASGHGVEAVRAKLAAAAPDIVYVGLGCPKQERLIVRLAPSLPATWFVASGAAIAYTAKALPRAPRWMQQAGLSWLFRLAHEPRRLFRRYVIDDLPFAGILLTSCLAARVLRFSRR